MKLIVLSSNQGLIESIKRYLKYTHSIVEVDSFLVNNPGKNAYNNFLIIKAWLEGLYVDNISKMRETMAFIDLPITDFTELKPTLNSAGGLASLLFLSFPEIYWVFLTSSSHIQTQESDESVNWQSFFYFHTLSNKDTFFIENVIDNFLHGYTPLFDSTGFRNYLVEKTLEQMEEEKVAISPSRPFFSERKQNALVIDEEISYSFLHSYVAYKFGFRSMMVTTKNLLEKLNTLKKSGDPRKLSDVKFDISFEDISLSFPDEPIDYEDRITHSLEKRDDTYKFVRNIPKRIFVTIGEEKVLKSQNKEYRKRLRRDSELKFYKVLYKPYSGIFNLKKEAKLKPYRQPKPTTDRTSGGHSQPGRLGMIADILINRSRDILEVAKYTIDAIYAAMLALQAQEILGGRTATESIKAISLKHQAEVLAECIFYGVEHNFDMRSRFKEIENELRIIGRWFGKSKRDIMIYNSELNIINELARIFRQYSQFDEEQMCLNKVRSLNRKIYTKRNKIWGWLVTPLRWYFEFLVGSLPRFLAAIVLWPLFFALLNSLFLPSLNKPFFEGLIYSINSFFALQFTSFNDITPLYLLLTILPILLGFFHLGIFISHLYTIVSRK